MRAWILLCFLLQSGPEQADEPTITVSVGNDTRSFTQGELLARQVKKQSKTLFCTDPIWDRRNVFILPHRSFGG
jgi:hypothetical protein